MWLPRVHPAPRTEQVPSLKHQPETWARESSCSHLPVLLRTAQGELSQGDSLIYSSNVGEYF